MTAVTKDETKEFITKRLNGIGDTASNYMLVASLDKLMNGEKSRASGYIIEFRDLIFKWLKDEGKVTEQDEKSFRLLSTVFTEKVLPERIKKEQNLHKIAIEGYLYDNIQPQKPNDSDSAVIGTVHEGILLTLTREGIIDEDQANERSIFPSLFDDEKEPIKNELQN